MLFGMDADDPAVWIYQQSAVKIGDRPLSALTFYLKGWSAGQQVQVFFPGQAGDPCRQRVLLWIKGQRRFRPDQKFRGMICYSPA